MRRHAIFFVMLALLGCQRASTGPAQANSGAAQGQIISLTGAGSTFVYPLFSKWFAAYNRFHPEVQANYQSIGSGGGVKQFTEKTVDFGASDAFLTDDELQKVPDALNLPVTSGAVVPVVNIPEVTALRLTPETLAAIFLGKVTTWSDPALAVDNPNIKLPNLGIVVAHRSDGSGTTAIFTDYLSKVSPEWKAGPGTSKSINWPAGLGGKGNDGVSGLVRSTPGAIGYVELAYATQNKMTIAALRNHDGAFVLPTLEGVTAAAGQATIPDDFRVSITDAPGKETWPISGFTWVLLRKDLPDAVKGEAVLRLFWWGLHDGQKMAAGLDFAPLPPTLISRIEKRLQSLTVQGKRVSFPADASGK